VGSHVDRMGLTEQPGTERTRAKQADVTALLAGAWADVDVVSPWHAKPGLATTHDEALGALTAAMMPTVALRTPGGVQASGCVRRRSSWGPPRCASTSPTSAPRSRPTATSCSIAVWNADRLMRLPGSVHYGSGEPVDVVTLWADGRGGILTPSGRASSMRAPGRSCRVPRRTRTARSICLRCRSAKRRWP
jgi:hypothetical protein